MEYLRTYNGPETDLLLHLMLYDKIDDCYENKRNDAIFDILAILKYLVLKLIFWHNAVEIPSKTGENTIPYACSYGSEENEAAKIHPCKSGRNTDEMTYARN